MTHWPAASKIMFLEEEKTHILFEVFHLSHIGLHQILYVNVKLCLLASL